LTLQEDGNLVLYKKDGGLIWSSETRGAARLQVQNDGNVVLYDANGNVKWATESSIDAGKRRLAERRLAVTVWNFDLPKEKGGWIFYEGEGEFLRIEMQITAATESDIIKIKKLQNVSVPEISDGLVPAGIHATVIDGVGVWHISDRDIPTAYIDGNGVWIIPKNEAACTCWMAGPSAGASVHRESITCPELKEFLGVKFELDPWKGTRLKELSWGDSIESSIQLEGRASIQLGQDCELIKIENLHSRYGCSGRCFQVFQRTHH
jgi:hypothetical protein